MKYLFFITISALLIFTAVSAALYLSGAGAGKSAVPDAVPVALKEKLSGIAVTAQQYANEHQFNEQFCFLVDMSIASGKPRFFVYDMKKNAVVRKGLVAHGRCNQNWLAGRKYGNTVGCGCTSLGKYRVGNAYRGRFGLAYKLNGLDTTNSNAYSRFVVLHSHECVPEAAVDPSPICQSDGCPTVSAGFLKDLAGIVDASQQPVLLWIFE